MKLVLAWPAEKCRKHQRIRAIPFRTDSIAGLLFLVTLIYISFHSFLLLWYFRHSERNNKLHSIKTIFYCIKLSQTVSHATSQHEIQFFIRLFSISMLNVLFSFIFNCQSFQLISIIGYYFLKHSIKLFHSKEFRIRDGNNLK